MMKMFNPVVICILAVLALHSTAWANTTTAKPQCPTANEIRSVGVGTVAFNQGFYATTKFDAYHTANLWGFGIVNIVATSRAEALKKANAALSSLEFVSGPHHSPSLNAWGCFYSIGSGLHAEALTVSQPTAHLTDDIKSF
jgi:hypothetical protein